MKIASKSDPKGDHFFDIFVHRLWERFGANLAPKTLPKWSQIGTKIDASWGVDLALVLEGILAPFWEGFGGQVGAKLAPNLSKSRFQKISKK